MHPFFPLEPLVDPDEIARGSGYTHSAAPKLCQSRSPVAPVQMPAMHPDAGSPKTLGPNPLASGLSLRAAMCAQGDNDAGQQVDGAFWSS